MKVFLCKFWLPLRIKLRTGPLLFGMPIPSHTYTLLICDLLCSWCGRNIGELLSERCFMRLAVVTVGCAQRGGKHSMHLLLWVSPQTWQQMTTLQGLKILQTTVQNLNLQTDYLLLMLSRIHFKVWVIMRCLLIGTAEFVRSLSWMHQAERLSVLLCSLTILLSSLCL